MVLTRTLMLFWDSQDPLRGLLFMCHVSNFAMGEGRKKNRGRVKTSVKPKMLIVRWFFPSLLFHSFHQRIGMAAYMAKTIERRG